MKKQKLSVPSVRSNNMNNVCYMKVHRRMYLTWDSKKDIPARLHLDYDLSHLDKDVNVSFEITKEAAYDFLHYEMSFDLLLSLFSGLCIKYGSFQIPF